MSFNPSEHITQLKGKSYLEVKWRLVWFREEHPDWGVSTEIVAGGFADGYAVVRASVADADGKLVSTGYKSQAKQGFADFIEKAETGAIGRALALAGYGTQFCDEFDESPDRPADSPVDKKPSAKANGAKATPPANKEPWIAHGLTKDEYRQLQVDAGKVPSPKLEELLDGCRAQGYAALSEIVKKKLAFADEDPAAEALPGTEGTTHGEAVAL